jgi:hypothetical protein
MGIHTRAASASTEDLARNSAGRTTTAFFTAVATSDAAEMTATVSVYTGMT